MNIRYDTKRRFFAILTYILLENRQIVLKNGTISKNGKYGKYGIYWKYVTGGQPAIWNWCQRVGSTNQQLYLFYFGLVISSHLLPHSFFSYLWNVVFMGWNFLVVFDSHMHNNSFKWSQCWGPKKFFSAEQPQVKWNF